jgi:NAD(P)-dependent dehydrogenase (short-subunit alcohol dehydrogenase family)
MSTAAPLTGRVALVTGSTRGVGRAIAERLVDEGVTVVVHGTRDADARRVAGEIGAVLGAGADLDDGDQVDAMSERVRASVGPIDILVNNAGISIRSTFLETDTELWDRTLQIDLRAPIELIRASLPGMVERGWGRVLNVTSAAGVEATPGFAAYAAAKGALVGLTLTLAAEVEASGVRVNALSPIAMTDMLRQLPPKYLDDLIARGVPTPEHCADRAMALLAQDAPSGVHDMVAFGDG